MCKANECVTIVIVYTNVEKLNEAKMWIQKQTTTADIEIIDVDNRARRFSSAANALNYGAEQSRGDYVIFMHQDVYLWVPNAIEIYRQYLKEKPNHIIGIAGVPAGMTTVTDIYETKERVERGIRANGQNFQVDALDECLLAMTKKKWEELHFDEECCNNWHGYAMDICFANTLRGGTNVMVPLKVCHDSFGNAENAGFRNTIGRLIRKYRGTEITQIHGTCVEIDCTLGSYYWYRVKGFLKDIKRTILWYASKVAMVFGW